MVDEEGCGAQGAARLLWAAAALLVLWWAARR